MNQTSDFFTWTGGYMGLGVVMLAAGVVLLIIARRSEPDKRRTLRFIGWPLLGCGGCLVIVPILIVIAVVVLGVAILSCSVGKC